MDIVGPLPRSRSGNRYVLVLCDYASRYPEAIPLKSIDAETIAEELVIIFAIPKEIRIHQLLQVGAIRTSPYHPQCDGLVGRFNQTLKSMLEKNSSGRRQRLGQVDPIYTIRI